MLQIFGSVADLGPLYIAFIAMYGYQIGQVFGGDAIAANFAEFWVAKFRRSDSCKFFPFATFGYVSGAIGAFPHVRNWVTSRFTSRHAFRGYKTGPFNDMIVFKPRLPINKEMHFENSVPRSIKMTLLTCILYSRSSMDFVEKHTNTFLEAFLGLVGPRVQLVKVQAK